MAKLDKEDLLAAWQVLWGQLDPKWHQMFLDDPLVNKIIWYDSKFIYPALKQFQKLSEVLTEIQSKTTIENLNETKQSLIEYLEEREEISEHRKKRGIPKPEKPNPRDIKPLEPIEVTIEDLRRQPGEKHWW